MEGQDPVLGDFVSHGASSDVETSEKIEVPPRELTEEEKQAEALYSQALVALKSSSLSTKLDGVKLLREAAEHSPGAAQKLAWTLVFNDVEGKESEAKARYTHRL